jgi:hypothetical protein
MRFNFCPFSFVDSIAKAKNGSTLIFAFKHFKIKKSATKATICKQQVLAFSNQRIFVGCEIQLKMENSQVLTS